MELADLDARLGQAEGFALTLAQNCAAFFERECAGRVDMAQIGIASGRLHHSTPWSKAQMTVVATPTSDSTVTAAFSAFAWLIVTSEIAESIIHLSFRLTDAVSA
ncbi:hypothetical protein [Caballeronia sp. ATUFL_M2_KS44]|uniref:hypothetical protein n=1 Tax=Caballeronia sp. ATUFL_M2_KS44 TaxID=2921767 RepID=UPI002028ACAF|nr:hypothetical protein [Caballeronia sp. ATUFL_M2_KS44]